MNHRRTCIVSVLAIVGCADAELQEWNGEHVTITTSQSIELCGETVEFWDAYVGQIARYWNGEEPDPDMHMTVSLRVYEPDFEFGGLASFDDGQAWASSQGAVLHEATHLVTGWYDGLSLPALSEGAATSLSTNPELPAQWGQVLTHPSEFFFLSYADFGSRYYAPAGQLFQYLVRRYGIAMVREAYVHLSNSALPRENEAALVDVFGDEIYDAFDDMYASRQCGLQAWQCSEIVVPEVQLPISLQSEEGCQGDGSVGALENGEATARWHPYHQFSFTLPAETVLEIDLRDNSIVGLERCISSCDDARGSLLSFGSGVPSSGVQLPLSPGRYFVTVQARDRDQPYAATIRRVE